MFRLVQPWGHDAARESTVVSEHATAAEAFAEIDRVATVTLQNGTGSDYLRLVVLDSDGRIVTRPVVH